MFKISGLLSIAVTFVFGAMLFWTSQAVQDVERNLAQNKNAIEREKESIRVLSTEWDYLNRPQRLERLAVEGIGMEDVDGGDVGVVSDISEIPEPVMPAIPSIKPASLMRIEPAASSSSSSENKGGGNFGYEREDFDKLLDSVYGGAVE